MASPIVLVADREYVLAPRSQRVVAGIIDVIAGFLPMTLAGEYGFAVFPFTLAYLFMGDGIFRGASLG